MLGLLRVYSRLYTKGSTSAYILEQEIAIKHSINMTNYVFFVKLSI